MPRTRAVDCPQPLLEHSALTTRASAEIQDLYSRPNGARTVAIVPQAHVAKQPSPTAAAPDRAAA